MINNDNGFEDFEDKYCILQAQIVLEQFVQAKMIKEIMEEETDPEQKQLLKTVLEEEKAEYKKAKAKLDECLIINGNDNPYNKGSG